jgi:hypothetical protein
VVEITVRNPRLTFIVQQHMAQQLLTQFEEHPDAWTRVPDVLERSSFPQSKVLSMTKAGL